MKRSKVEIYPAPFDQYLVHQIGIYFSSFSMFSLLLLKNNEPKQRNAEPKHNHTMPIEVLFPPTMFIIAAK